MIAQLTIDLVICTYNRPDSCLYLIQQVLSHTDQPNKIIVVDASEQPSEALQSFKGIYWLSSSHKNQPFQRYVGYAASKADVLLYLDDDMEISHANYLKSIRDYFLKNELLSGLALAFTNKVNDGSLSSIPNSAFKQNSVLKRYWNWLSAYPSLPTGTFGLCGNRGKQPALGGFTQWVSGGAFAARRSCLYTNFNFQLFDLFEQRIGMGEDGILGYTLSKAGKVYYEPTSFFWHHEKQTSHYATKHEAYAKRVLFSRLYLSLEKARLDRTSFFYAKLHYRWYALCRLMGYSLNYLKSRSTARKEILIGSWNGFKQALQFSFASKKERNGYWEQELLKLQAQTP